MIKETPNQKRIRIALGSCKRLAKDLECYRKEKASEESKISEMKEQNADIYDIRQLEAVLKQTVDMIELVKKDIEKANEALSQLLEEMEDDEQVLQTDIYKQAHAFLSAL